jgi:hypothetical protein
VKWPTTIAIQMSPAISSRVISMTVHSPSGMTICEIMEIYRGCAYRPCLAVLLCN